MDILLLLPPEVFEHILSFLPAKDIINVSHVCSLWRKITDNDRLWKKICEQESIPFEVLPSDFDDEPDQRCKWSRLYLTTLQRIHNWTKQNFTEVLIPETFQINIIIYSLHFYGSLVMVGTDNSLNIYQVKENQLFLLQCIKIDTTIKEINTGKDTIVFGDNYYFVYKFDDNLYKPDIILDVENDILIENPELKIKDHKYMPFLITNNYIWFRIINDYNYKIYDRLNKNFKNLNMDSSKSFSKDNYVFSLNQRANIYDESGFLIHSIKYRRFQYIIAFSSFGMAFVNKQSTDITYFDINTTKISTIVEREPVESMVLHQNNLIYVVYLIHSYAKYKIVSQKEDKTLWSTDLINKDENDYSLAIRVIQILQVLCSKLIIVSIPSQYALLCLLDLKTGVKISTICLEDGFINLTDSIIDYTRTIEELNGLESEQTEEKTRKFLSLSV